MLRWHCKKRTVALLTVGLLVLTAGAVAVSGEAEKPPAPEKPPNLIVHEWGTFLSVQGSDGATLGGMVASEEVLPPFVESRSVSAWNRTLSLTKMETPVTYFYTDQPQMVSVRVDMPHGLLTHWYPMVRAFGPNPRTTPAGPGSFLNWERVYLIPNSPTQPLPAGSPVPTLWRVKPDDAWRFARQTDAALVRAHSRNMEDLSEFDYEKFLFYRGLGTFDMPLQVLSAEGRAGTQLTLRNRGKQPLQGLFAIQVDDQTIRFAAVHDLAGEASTVLGTGTLFQEQQPLDEGVPEVKKAVVAALVKAGLYSKEAQAMVNSWEKSYFRTPGLRFLYALPRELVDALIPIQIKPAPTQLVRVMVGRAEVLTPAVEQQIEGWIRQLGSNDFQTRENANAALARLGRLSEPALRRVLAISKDAEVRARVNKLIQTAMSAP